jgi:hypothetical protein
MREGISIEVSGADRARLAAVVADRNSPQKHVWRAQIILATAEGCGTAEVMRRAGVSKPCVWRWQERFMREGVAGLLRDKTRKPGLPPLPPTLVGRVVTLTLTEPPDEATHWTGRTIGNGHRCVAALGAADLGGAPPAAAPRATLQAVAVESFFASLTRRRLQRGVFRSLVDLQAAINRYLKEHNRKPKPFVWTVDPDGILFCTWEDRLYYLVILDIRRQCWSVRWPWLKAWCRLTPGGGGDPGRQQGLYHEPTF